MLHINPKTTYHRNRKAMQITKTFPHFLFVAAVATFAATAFSQETAKPSSSGSPVVQQHLQLNQLLQSIDPYLPGGTLQGKTVLSGSTTMSELGKNWAERFKLFHPGVEFARGVDGSEAALESLAKDPNVIVGISRPVTEAEIAKLKSGKCKEPMIAIVALDPMAIFVHKDNPIEFVTPEQVKLLFGASTNGKPLASAWGELGVKGEFSNKPIHIHHRSEVSGTRNFIQHSLLGDSPLAEPKATHRSNAEICEAIAKDPYGVGLCGFGDAVAGTRPVPLMLNGAKIEATEESFLAGRYPLVRPLSLVFDRLQAASDNGLRASIMRYILSRDGQSEAIRAGFFPLDPNFIRQELAQLGGTQIR